ncbi:hypothetical protein GQ42DRAFT_158576 [Ramicandelaber brevisporus]|nr:hypothetical protein GQ42DRAFT_158576 [Ramicandelaber brevisporus]
MNQADRVRAKLLQLISSASDDELFKINNTLAETGHLDLSRCRKPDSPFPLFDLPLELLEHSARYLSRREAAPMLTFNRLFHDVFSRVVWRSIRTSWIKKSKIKPSALSRYGHLVNQLHIDAERFAVARIASLVPNVMMVSIINDASGSNLQAGQLDLLRNLRKVIFCAYDLSEVMFDPLGDWINSDSLSGHVNLIELSFVNIRCSGRYLNNIYRTSNVTFPFVTRFGLFVCCAGPSALPNLITLDYASNADSYDFADTLPKFKFLQVLTLRDYYSNPGTGLSSTITMPSEVMNRLRSMKLREMALTTDVVRFIFNYCPNLLELKLGGCAVSGDVVEHANEISKTCGI